MPQPERIDEPLEKPVGNTLGILVRLFFSRFFEKESLSPQGDSKANVVQVLGILAAPGALIPLILYLNPEIKAGWNLVIVRCLFLCFSMVVIAFVVVFEWGSLFLDSRDYQILSPLPIPFWKLFVAKMIAFVSFLGLFLASINGIATLVWSSFLEDGNFLVVVGTHLLVVLVAGLFSAFAAASIQSLLFLTVPAKIFRSVATFAQTILMTLLVILFFVSPLIASGIRIIMTGGYIALAHYVPVYWFSGLYERLRPAVGNAGLLNLGYLALPASGSALVVFALTQLPLYRRHAHKLIETPPPDPSGPGMWRVALNVGVRSVLLKDPVQEAIYRFIGQTISRSMKHRLFLAIYAGFGAALVVVSVAPSFLMVGPGSIVIVAKLGPDRLALLSVPLTLSFVLVSGLRAAFNFPAELSANWAFQMTDTGHTKQCLIAVRKWIIVCGILPLFLILAPLELRFFSWTVVLFQTFYGVTLSALLTEVMFFDFRKIPFTCGYLPESNNLVWFIAMYVCGLILYSSTMANLEIQLMWRPLFAVLFFASAAIVWLVSLKSHGRRKAKVSLDYLGDDDPIIRTLDLTPY